MLLRTRFFVLGLVSAMPIAISAICVVYAFTDDKYIDDFIDLSREYLQS